MWNLFKHLWRLICLWLSCTTCNPDWLSHTQCNWPLGGEILLLANTWQPKFFFSLPFSVFSWDVDKILSYKSKPWTKILILLCFNSPYYILVFFIIVRWGEWRLGPDGKLPAAHTLVVLPTCLHRHVSSEKLTGHRSIIWMHADCRRVNVRVKFTLRAASKRKSLKKNVGKAKRWKEGMKVVRVSFITFLSKFSLITIHICLYHWCLKAPSLYWE